MPCIFGKTVPSPFHFLAELQGTKSSKKKKQAKLKRVMATVKRQARKENSNPHDSFAAVQLLNDPQV